MYERIFRQGPTRSLILGPGAPYRITDASDSYLETTLTTREIVDRPMFAVFPDNPDDPTATGVRALTASLERALAGRTTDVMPVQRYDIRDRSGKFVERHWTPINTTIVADDGTRLMLVHRTEDVTPFVREGEVLSGEAAQLRHQVLLQARDLALANAALHESIEYRRRIVAIVGHDLRNPLSAISNGVSVLRAHFEKMGAAPPRTIDLVQSAARRMEALLRDLDDYAVSQVEGRLPIAREWVNLRDVCLDVVRAMSLARPGARVVLDPGENVGAYVDPGRKRQVLTNLITNALDHGAEDRPVRISLRRVTGGCAITVSNEGEPIPRDVLPTLFEPFRRGPGNGRAQGWNHLGLGLYIVQQLVQAHDGRVGVESTPRGTHFMVFIPIA